MHNHVPGLTRTDPILRLAQDELYSDDETFLDPRCRGI